MSIFSYLVKFIDRKDKPIVVNNVIANHCVGSVRGRINTNKKNLIINYILLLFFYFIISKEISCLFIEESDLKSRINVFDLTLFFGGVRVYTSYVMILAWSAASMLFKFIHLNNDKRLMKWIEIFEYINGRKTLSKITQIILTPAQEDMLKYCCQINVKCATITISLLSM